MKGKSHKRVLEGLRRFSAREKISSMKCPNCDGTTLAIAETYLAFHPLEGVRGDGTPIIASAFGDTSNFDDGASDFDLFCRTCGQSIEIPAEWSDKDWEWK